MNDHDYTTIITRLREMRLPAMAEQIMMLIENGRISDISVYDVLDIITSEEQLSRKNNTIRRNKKNAHLSQPMASLADLDHSPSRKLNEQVLGQITSNTYISRGRNVVIMGSCGCGKSYLCNALANHACENQYTVLYTRMFEMSNDITQGKLMGQDINQYLKKYIKPDLLIIDDFLISGHMTTSEADDLYKVLDLRYGVKSTIVAAQYEIAVWHKILGGNVLADSILDRITKNAYKLILSGDSKREKLNP